MKGDCGRQTPYSIQEALQVVLEFLAGHAPCLMCTIHMQAFLPLLGTDLTLSGPPGKILNISSVYASYTLPFAVRPLRVF